MIIHEQEDEALTYTSSNIYDSTQQYIPTTVYNIGDEVKIGDEIHICVDNVEKATFSTIYNTCSSSSGATTEDVSYIMSFPALVVNQEWNYPCGETENASTRIKAKIITAISHGTYKTFTIEKTPTVTLLLLGASTIGSKTTTTYDIYDTADICPLGKYFIHGGSLYQKNVVFSLRSVFKYLRPIRPLLLLDNERNTKVEQDDLEINLSVLGILSGKNVKSITLERVHADKVELTIDNVTTTLIPKSIKGNGACTEVIEIAVSNGANLKIKMTGTKCALYGIYANKPKKQYKTLFKKYKSTTIDTQQKIIDSFGRPIKRTRPLVSEISLTIPSQNAEETNIYTLLWKELSGKYFTIDPTDYYENQDTGLYTDIIRGQLFTSNRNLVLHNSHFNGEALFDLKIREIL